MKKITRRVADGLLRPVCFMTILLALSACSAPLAVVGIGADTTTHEVEGVTDHKIFFSTTRARSANERVYFGGARNPRLTNGELTIGVPASHQAGKMEIARNEDHFDPKKHFSVGEPLVYRDTPEFVQRLQSEIASRPRQHRNILIFVHGYNTSFSNAITRVTQFVHDTGFDGVPILFTWASRARAADYTYDINSALQARFHMAELALAMQQLKIDEFNIVAHSMGNLATLETLVVLSSMPEFKPHGKLNSIILAAPDVDFDLFKEHMVTLTPIHDKIFVLISSDDKALNFSRFLAGGVNRAGAADPEQLAELGVTVVDLSSISSNSLIDHSKFSDSPEIVRLIGRSISEGNTLFSEPGDAGLKAGLGGMLNRISSTATGGRVLVLQN